jgi:hypothetical protein
MKLLHVTEMHLNETYEKVCRDKHLSDAFPVQNGLKKGDALLSLRLLLAWLALRL